ncbi:CdaR family transcriptional regulator [Paenibacillaceae bacterium WGS1546]|uniref:CdaR family transcriptional regulator n=1 Tax=Cohnella sp. WGS1546 TaxID=3366810 RepID=UPI00372D754D
MLTQELARTIVEETMKRVKRNVNIFDADGKVLASGDPSRIGSYHEAAMEAANRQQPYAVKPDEARRWKGALPGINLPVEFEGAVVGAVGVTGDPNEMLPYAELVKMTAELMLQQEQIGLDRNWKQSLAGRIAEQLLEPGTTQPDVRELNRRLQPIPFALRPPYRVAAIEPGPGDTEADASLYAELFRRFSDAALVGHHRTGHYALIFSGQSESRVSSLLESLAAAFMPHAPLAIGVGTPVDSLEELPSSCCESLIALEWSDDVPRVSYYESLSWQAFAREIGPDFRRAVADRFAPILAPKVRETLEAHFACNLSIAAAAKRLGIHRNTMIYRLEQIRARSGCDPLDFRDAVALQLALWIIAADGRERGVARE